MYYEQNLQFILYKTTKIYFKMINYNFIIGYILLYKRLKSIYFFKSTYYIKIL